ncbi:putative adenosine deaminase [Talaromyces proteolyticus]|uniref:Adenosine deaminase n=1 Tax=Talaromyces proteolyticus TaxID=1131652 RepID=A0AAD4KTF1_9EURO|nr:putative adenosine deaminase [Talaromyces proteolyticus]KAH8698470.1 putative adenosine deaminase [Talaromyces proteolyticus]
MATSQNLSPVTELFTKRLPKIELHAHLSGSITRECLHEIWLRKKSHDPNFDLDDPWVLMPPGKVDYRVNIFFDVFSKMIYQLCNDVDSILCATSAVLNDFKRDGVRYLELRTTPREIRGHDGEIIVSKETYILTVLSAIDAFRQDQTKANNVDGMVVYLILSIDRARDNPESAMQVVDLALKHRIYNENLAIIGIDLCGNPNKGDVSIFRSAFALARSEGLKITLHFAETLFSGEIKELETLLSFAPDRLGHVIHVPDAIKEKITDRGIGLELCMSCNVHAKMIKGGFEDHHFAYWLKTACPLALCTDDVGFFCSPVSQEYFLAAKHFGLNRSDLIALCVRGVDAIFGGENEKSRLRQLLEDFTLEG